MGGILMIAMAFSVSLLQPTSAKIHGFNSQDHEATLYTYRPGDARSRQSQAMRDELKNKIQALAESERSAHPETRQAMREMLKKLHNIMALAERQHSERVMEQQEEAAKRRAAQEER